MIINQHHSHHHHHHQQGRPGSRPSGQAGQPSKASSLCRTLHSQCHGRGGQEDALHQEESSKQRRERRLRAESRVYTRLVLAAQAATSHHSQETRLVQVMRAFLRKDNANDGGKGIRTATGRASGHDEEEGPHNEGLGCQTTDSMRADAPVFAPVQEITAASVQAQATKPLEQKDTVGPRAPLAPSIKHPLMHGPAMHPIKRVRDAGKENMEVPLHGCSRSAACCASRQAGPRKQIVEPNCFLSRAGILTGSHKERRQASPEPFVQRQCRTVPAHHPIHRRCLPGG